MFAFDWSWGLSPQSSAPIWSDVMKEERLLLPPPEAAESLSISERKLWEQTKLGNIPCVRIGRCVRYSPETLRAWIIDQERSSREVSK